MGLWTSALKKPASDRSKWWDQSGKNSRHWRYPPSPHTSEWLAGRGVCKKCLQNLDCRSLRGQNL